MIDDRLQSYPFLPQFDLALADAAEIHKIVDQAHHLVELTLGDPARQLEILGRQIGSLHQLDGVADRRQGVSQLVRQDRQKLVFAPVGFFQLLAYSRSAFSTRLRSVMSRATFDAPTIRPRRL